MLLRIVFAEIITARIRMSELCEMQTEQRYSALIIADLPASDCRNRACVFIADIGGLYNITVFGEAYF